MYQKKLTSQLSLALISLFSLLSYSQITLAGTDIIRGASIESSSFSNTLDGNQVEVQDTSITVEGDTIRVSDQIQLELNKDIDEILSSDDSNDVIIALIRGDNIDFASEKITSEFAKVGVNSELTEQLKTTLADLLLDSDSKSVNINQLNAAIKIYNQIVQKTDDNQLIALSELPEFKKVSEILKKLRRTVDCSTERQSNECVNF